MKLNNKLLKLIRDELLENVGFDSEASKLTKRFKDLSKMRNEEKTQLVNKSLFTLTTLRNKLLITPAEQERVRKKVVTFLGLSVGSHAAIAWMMESRANTVKISDPDIISLSNLNRLSCGLKNVGSTKVSVVEKKLKEINPNCSVLTLRESSLEKMKSFILRDPKTDVIIDQMDTIEGKVILRKVARRFKIPVLMATDVGDNVFLDVERYDKDSKVKFFNGRVSNIESLDFSKLSKDEKITLSVQIVGLNHNSERMLQSLSSIGKSIKTWPQLGTTAIIAGGIIAKTIRKIFVGEKIESKRYHFSLEELLVGDYKSREREIIRNKLSDDIIQGLRYRNN
jgi:molybdopterin/thiamine biosynthesis adenylyltransferase